MDLKRRAEQATLELSFAKQGIESNQIPAYLAEPLIERISAFVEHTTERISELQKLFSETRQKVLDVRAFFGDSNSDSMPGNALQPMENSSVCISKSFFEMIVQFATKYGNAAKEIAFWKDQVKIPCDISKFYNLCIYFCLFIFESNNRCLNLFD